MKRLFSPSLLAAFGSVLGGLVLWTLIVRSGLVSTRFTPSCLDITVSTIARVKSVPVQILRAGYSLGASDRKSFLYVVLPAALPQIMVGLRLASAISWTLVVAAELIAAQRGLGYMIMDASTFFRVKDVYVGLIVIGIIGFLLESSIASGEGRLVHWRGT